MTHSHSSSSSSQPHIVIVGGGFGGLYTAQALGNQPVRVTLVDKRNFHLFQPLLYQVATGSLSPGDIATPLRSILHSYQNINVVLDEVVGIDPDQRQLQLKEAEKPLDYDILILATGSMTHFFGHDQWAKSALELKSLENALDMRRQILCAFEAAERETDPAEKAAWMTFVIVGGGPTGVELAGALAELAHTTLREDFRHIDCHATRIMLVEAGSRLLGAYPEESSQWTAQKLESLGVVPRVGTMVTDIEKTCITLSKDGQTEKIQARTVLWAAGVKASGLGGVLAERLHCELDRGGRVMVEPDLSVPGHPEIFVLGDLAHYAHTPEQKPLPGIAPVAMQQGRYVAKRILAEQHGKPKPVFQYRDKGNLAVISFSEAVAVIGKLRLTGIVAWFIWAFVHIFYLVEFDSKFLVLFQWAWAFFTRKRSARLITGTGVYD